MELHQKYFAEWKVVKSFLVCKHSSETFQRYYWGSTLVFIKSEKLSNRKITWTKSIFVSALQKDSMNADFSDN